MHVYTPKYVLSETSASLVPVHMYIYIYMNVCMYVNAHIHIWIYTNTYEYLSTYLNIYVYVCTAQHEGKSNTCT